MRLSRYTDGTMTRFWGTSSCCFIFLYMIVFVFSIPAAETLDSTLTNHALSETEYKISMGSGYVFFGIVKPVELWHTYKVIPATFSPSFNESYFGRSNDLVISDPLCGCGYLKNAANVKGNLVLMERGECSFVSKVVRAEEAGAIGVIITGEDPENDELFISMSDDLTRRTVYIPSGYLLGKNGEYIRRVLEKQGLDRAVVNIPVNITSVPITDLHQPPWLIW